MIQSLVRAFKAMICCVLVVNPIEVPVIEDEYVIPAYFSCRADPTFGSGIGLGCLR